jgi:translation initiation factor 1
MPFTVDGNWIPNKTDASKKDAGPKKPVRVELKRRGNNVVTIVHNLQMNENELDLFAARLKKKFGCGGARKENTVEVQGDKVSQVQQFLTELGVKVRPT